MLVNCSPNLWILPKITAVSNPPQCFPSLTKSHLSKAVSSESSATAIAGCWGELKEAGEIWRLPNSPKAVRHTAEQGRQSPFPFRGHGTSRNLPITELHSCLNYFGSLLSLASAVSKASTTHLPTQGSSTPRKPHTDQTTKTTLGQGTGSALLPFRSLARVFSGNLLTALLSDPVYTCMLWLHKLSVQPSWLASPPPRRRLMVCIEQKLIAISKWCVRTLYLTTPYAFVSSDVFRGWAVYQTSHHYSIYTHTARSKSRQVTKNQLSAL